MNRFLLVALFSLFLISGCEVGEEPFEGDVAQGDVSLDVSGEISGDVQDDAVSDVADPCAELDSHLGLYKTVIKLTQHPCWLALVAP